MVTDRIGRWEHMNGTSAELSAVMRHFDVHNRTEGKSDRTCQWYMEVLSMFHDWLRLRELPTDLRLIGEHDVREFILEIKKRPGRRSEFISSHTVANRVRALKAFFSWLARKGYLQDDVLGDVRTPKTSEKVVEPLTKEEIDRVFSAINRNTVLGSRNAALISLMLDTGLRVSEAGSLKERDVHLEDRYVKVIGKGDKERIVAFGAACQRAFLHYYYHFRVTPALPSIDEFFLSIDGYPLKPDGIKSLVKRLSKSARVERLHPHLMRHTYATSFLLNGGDVFLLKQNLGHSTLAMVELYVHMASRTAAVRSQTFSPLDHLDVKDTRRFKHSLAPANATVGQVYPNVGRGRRVRRRVGRHRA